MECYLKVGNKFVRNTRNRRKEGTDAILGTKAQAKIYSCERDAKKAKTTQEHQFPELLGRFVIVPVKKVKENNTNTTEQTDNEQ